LLIINFPLGDKGLLSNIINIIFYNIN